MFLTHWYDYRYKYYMFAQLSWWSQNNATKKTDLSKVVRQCPDQSNGLRMSLRS